MPESPEGGPEPHIVLIGLMGSGKTTVGKKVAKLLGRRFLDADIELEARTGRSVAAHFEEDGEAGFRDAEADLLDALLEESEPIVVGAGGGVVLEKRNRRRLARTDAATVYLHGEPDFLASRTQAKPHRPLLVGADPRELFERMYADRDPLYRGVADVVIEIRPHLETGEKPRWRTAEDVVDRLADLGIVAPVASTMEDDG